MIFSITCLGISIGSYRPSFARQAAEADTEADLEFFESAKDMMKDLEETEQDATRVDTDRCEHSYIEAIGIHCKFGDF